MGPDKFELGQVRDYLERQQRRIAELENENRTLRRELDELRRGIGIAVMIHGRTVPLAPLPAAGTAANPRPSATTSGQHPAVAPVPKSPIPGAGPTPHAQPTPSAAAFPATVPAAFSEASWLTGSQPAVRAQPRAERPAEPRQARSVRASEHITPEWLREASASQAPATSHRQAWEGTFTADTAGNAPTPVPATPSRYPAPPSQPGEWSAPRTARSRRSQASAPLPPLPLPSEPPYPSLAELTGQRPAVQRKPRRHANERNPFDDSFVLD